jgi:carbonic anhydrase/acetyltransferase-like protein (isoleucine patch superfamily)
MKQDFSLTGSSHHRCVNPLPDSVFLHPSSSVIGNVTMGEDCSIWPSVVLRADLGTIELGRGVNIQDGSILHTDSGGRLTIGDYTLVGHKSMLHGCSIGRACMIGIGSIILDGAEIGDGAMITAGCLIRGGMKIPPFALVVARDGELKIYENKARTILTVMGSLEYILLAHRYRKGEFGPISESEKKTLETEAGRILKDMFDRNVS